MNIQKSISFNDRGYHLDGLGKYYISNQPSKITGKRTLLHRDIWEYYNNKTVPDKHDIHHKDGNRYNNDISNLEPILSSKHRRDHMNERMLNPEFKENILKAQKKAIISAVDWHRNTEAGKAHHKLIARLSWEKKVYGEITCIVCGDKKITPFPTRTRYCGIKCQAKWDYANRPQVMAQGICRCGNIFTFRKSDKTKHCSLKCVIKKKMTEETKRKIIESRKNNAKYRHVKPRPKMSEETKLKISIAHKLNHAKK